MDIAKAALPGVPFFAEGPSPTLAAKEAHKIDKYSRLTMIGVRQHQQGKRAKKPLFAPFAISNTGQLGAGARALIEWLIAQYAAMIKLQSNRPDGLSTTDLVRSYRHRLETNIQIALANGIGLVINQAGLHRPS